VNNIKIQTINQELQGIHTGGSSSSKRGKNGLDIDNADEQFCSKKISSNAETIHLNEYTATAYKQSVLYSAPYSKYCSE